jgi:hypothetical protein
MGPKSKFTEMQKGGTEIRTQKLSRGTTCPLRLAAELVQQWVASQTERLFRAEGIVLKQPQAPELGPQEGEGDLPYERRFLNALRAGRR